MNDATAINKYVAELEGEGVHSFVVVIHEGGTQSGDPPRTVSDRILSITQALDPAVSVFVSGASHTPLDARVGNHLVVQASSFSRAFDMVHLLFDKDTGTVVTSWGTVQPVWTTTTPSTYTSTAPTVTPDPAVKAVVDAAVTETNPITQQLINYAAADIPSQREGGSTPAGDSPAGDLVADAQKSFTEVKLAFVNTGGIRAGLLAGPVTYGNLFTMQPFQDYYVSTFMLNGAQVWTLLNQQLAAGTGGIMQVAGLHFTYTGAQGQRLDHRRVARRCGRQLTPHPERHVGDIHIDGQLVHGGRR